MQAASIASRMRTMAPSLRALLDGVSRDDLRWRPDPNSWSILEIVCHLADEEAEDFRPRLESTLRDPAAPWPPLDLDDVAHKRGYIDRDLAEALSLLESKRAENLRWLGGVIAGSPDWSRAYRHPKIGTISAADLLSSWAAHDALHLRQIAKRLFQLAQRDGASTEYAGEWKA